MEKPAPPEVGKVTECSVELLWDQDRQPDDPNKPRTKYTVQHVQQQMGKDDNFKNVVYCGYARSCIIKRLIAKTLYKYRLQVSLGNVTSPWSSEIEVITADYPTTGDVLHRAVLNWDVEKIENILKANEFLVGVPDRMGASPLMVAAHKGFSSIVEVLLAHGADISFSNSSGKDSLMMACFAGHLRVAKELVENGASLHTVDQGGSTALHWAVDGGQAVMVEWLLHNGANVDELDNAKWTPLMRIATLGGSEDVAKVLLQNGANVHARDSQGKNVLMAAALAGQEGLVKLLVENGADVNETNVHGNTALDFAKSFDRQDVVAYLSTIPPASPN